MQMSCVCARERESAREREGKREGKRAGKKEGKRERARERERLREKLVFNGTNQYCNSHTRTQGTQAVNMYNLNAAS